MEKVKPTVKIKDFWKKSRYFRIFTWLLLILLFLQGILFFASDLLLRNLLREKIAKASDYKYEVDFERFHILFIQRGITFKGFELIPVEERFEANPDLPQYGMSLPEVSITGLNYLFSKKEISVNNVLLSSPSIEFKFSDERGETISPLETLQEQIQKSFLSTSVKEIRIKNLGIRDADFLLKNFIAQKSIKADNSNLAIKNIQLLQMREVETPLNADGFFLELDRFEMILADSVHSIFAEKLAVSSLKNFINADLVRITPDFEKPSPSYFELDLENLSLKDADINRVFYTSEVDVGSLALSQPSFVLYEPKKVKSDKRFELQSFDLYNLIDGILGSVSIEDLEIEEGKFAKKSVENHQDVRISSNKIDFKMKGFFVGPFQDRSANRFFYADDASLDIFDIDFALNDNIHRIRARNVLLSSFDDVININGFELHHPEDFEDSLNRSLLDIAVSELSIMEANLKRIYNEGILDLKDIVVEAPQIILRNIQTTKVEKSQEIELKRFFEEYLDGIYVERFEIKEGSLVVDNRLRVRQDSLSFGKVNLILENFALDESTGSSEEKGIFWAEHLQLELSDYMLRLADDLHIFKADRVFLNTRRKFLSIDGFAIRPYNPSQIQVALDRFGKSTSLDIYVPKFSASGVDIPRAYFEGILKIREIRVPAPIINLYRYRASNPEQTRETLDRQDILELLNSYFTEIKVDTMLIQRATLNYENYVGENLRTFAEDNVSIAVKNFHIHEEISEDAINSFFSEEVDLSLRNYVFNIADGRYNIIADRINFNTASEEIITRNVRLNPSPNFQGKTKVTARIPELSFRGVDIDAFLFDNELNLEKVKLSGSSVDLLIDNDWEETKVQATRRSRRDRNLPKNINVVEIDTVEASGAKFRLSYKNEGKENELVNTGINLKVFQFLMDSVTIQNENIAEFFKGLSLEVDEFWLTLNDSIHRLTFSKVEFDSRYESILLNNLRIIPWQLSGNPGKPIISAHIPAAIIQANSLNDLQRNKDLDLREIRIYRPDIEIFRDNEEIPKSENGEEREVKGFLETISIDDFELQEANLALFEKDGSGKGPSFKGVDLNLTRFQLDLQNLNAFDRKKLLENDFSVSVPDLNFLLKDSLNQVKAGVVTLANDHLTIKDFEFSPRMGRFAYMQKVGKQTDVANVKIPMIVLKAPDWEKYLDDELVVSESLQISDLHADIFRDKRYEREQGIIKPMPQALLQKSDLRVQLDTLHVENATIRYMEFPETGMLPGTLSFEELNASLYPFVIEKEENTYPIEKSTLLANAKLNGKADINLQGKLHYENPYPMEINAQMGPFELEELNSILMPNAFVRVTRGKINGADWSFTANDDEAVGSMLFLYEGLRLELLDETSLEKGKGRKKVLTFVLNTFAVRSNNPRRYLRKPIPSKIYEERDKERFIFNYWWRTTFTGLKGSLGLGQPKVPKELRKDAKRKKD